MDMVLLKSICKNLSNFNQKTVDIDFITEKRVSNHEIEENTITHLFSNIYKLNTVAFIGINASGKTSTMNVLSSLLDIYLGNSSLSFDMKLAKYFSDFIEVETFYYEKSSSTIYKIWSKIIKDEEKEVLYFEDEILYSKKANNKMNKEDIFKFQNSHKKLDRMGVDKTFLKQEDSIFSSLMNKNQRKSIKDMCNVTLNFLSAINKEMVMSFTHYLDPSIKKLNLITDTVKDSIKFEIKFENSDKDIIVNYASLDKYLSSGTIKGISFLSNVYTILNTGGYLLIDEIENHLNKIIVTNIIQMFSSKLNKNSATLLFSTHYSEILDAIERSDSIYVLNKKQDISINKFSKIAGAYDRIDKKKSDVILSGVIETAPKYNAYMNLLNAFREKLEEDFTND